MSVERNKQIAHEFFDALNRADGPALMSLYADDVELWTAGSMPFSGTHTLEELGPLMKDILGGFPEGLKFAVRAITAEGDRVAVEAESSGQHVSGQSYAQQYHFLFVIREDKIRQVKEYMDTQHAHEVLVQGARSI